MLTWRDLKHAHLRGRLQDPGTPDMLTWLPGQSGLASEACLVVFPRYSASCTLISFTTEDFTKPKENPLPETDCDHGELRENVTSRCKFTPRSATEAARGTSHTCDTKARETGVRPARRPCFWFGLVKREASFL